jgi:hypothetical protein
MLHAERRACQGKNIRKVLENIKACPHLFSVFPSLPPDSFAKSLHSHCCGLELGYNPLLFDVVNISIEDSKVIAKMFLRIQAKINLRNMPGRVSVVGSRN